MKLCVSHAEDGDAKEAKREEKTSAPDEGAPAFFDPLLHPPQHDEEREWATALLILIPLRLGLDHLNESYVPALEQTFAFPQSVGVIGGKKGHSVYFVGSQHGRLHLLDPHEVQPTTEINASFPTAVRIMTPPSLLCRCGRVGRDLTDLTDLIDLTGLQTHMRTVHSSRPLVMSVQSIDPSMALGFLCQDRADYLDFCARVKRLEAEADGLCPFSVASHRPDYGSNSMGDMLADCLSGDSMNEDAPSDDDDDEDYVLI
jgi:cysteine protease ATG4